MLPDTPKVRALLTLIEPAELEARPASRPTAVKPAKTSKPAEAPAAGAPVLDLGALRRAIYLKHGTNTVAAAEEWEKFKRDHPQAAAPS